MNETFSDNHEAIRIAPLHVGKSNVTLGDLKI